MIKSSQKPNSKEEVRNRIQAAASSLKQPVPHRELFEELLAQVPPINFSEVSGLEKVPYERIAVLVCEKVAELAHKNRWQIGHRDEFYWIYNKCFWQKISEPELEYFLGKAAERTGVEVLKARTYGYQEVLRKQFASTGYLPELPQEESNIRINLRNGTLHIEHGKAQLRDFNPDDFLRYQLPFSYDPQAQAPQWQKFLNEVLPDASLQKVLSEMLAYVFVPSQALKLEKCLFLYGTGSNGKSVVFEVISALLGTENVSNFSITSLTDHTGYYRALLAGKLLNYASEIGGEMESSLFKQLVSGEPIEARLPYKEPQIIRNYAKLIFNANSLPDVPEFTHAFFRRFAIIPFEVTIPDHKQDRDLPQRIIATELPGVLNWILEGLQRLTQQRGLSPSEKMASQISRFRLESNPVAVFISERIDDCRLENDVNGWISVADLFQDYTCWTVENGHKKMSKRKFSERMEGLGYSRGRNTKGTVRIFTGLHQKLI
ncbi:phage/plasmid primase, P4 family [Cytophagaceae bacterium DM2B3-1]|uniref:Phage/plasmid primase, P4 family n=1 Tax=Xanthocytophaga flava TaxID=3048013 RepID=A0ABT7CFI4_9BACT|nr:phage/plasmid primase, P4 family [Xanthocytophaga flavus]MDJ1492475.1 phage/plasmid primase, P4 family [Xanthocytophaga flavus]